MTMFKWIEFIVSTANWHLHRYLPSTYSRIKSCAALVADFQHFLKWVQGGGQKRHSVFGGHGAGRADLQIVVYFQELVLWARFLHLLKFRKALNPSCWWLLLVTSRNLLLQKKKKMLDFMCLFFTKITYIQTIPNYLFGAVSHSYLRCCLGL